MNRTRGSRILRRLDDARLLATGRTIARKYAHFTMIAPGAFVGNLLLVSRARDLPGCVVECGVWRGGMSAGMAEVLGPDRDYYLFDSFEGLPPAGELDGAGAVQWQRENTAPEYHDNCSAEMSFAQQAMALSPARRVTLKKGWFADTLPGFEPAQGIAVLRLDGDWYDSTRQCLDALYRQVVPGGVVIIDDYYRWEGCTKAVHDFLSQEKTPDRIRQSKVGGIAYIVRGA